MSADLDKISQITIYLKSPSALAEKVNEVALFNPLSRKATFDEESETLSQRKWTFHHHLPILRRFILNIQSFFFHNLKLFIPLKRKTPEAKFKTALSILLAQESLREYFLGTDEKKQHFFAACKIGAGAAGYKEFSVPSLDQSGDEIANEMTRLEAHKKSLIEDLVELNLQMASLSTEERNEILFAILNNISRPPVTSVIETWTHDEKAYEIELVTKYAKIQVHEVDPKSGRIDFSLENNSATSSIETRSNIAPGAKGAMNQRMVLEKNSRVIGCYCGNLSTSNNILEQLIFLLQEEKATHIYLLDSPPSGKMIEDKAILFTSLFSWNEYGKILAEHEAIDALHGKILKIVKNGRENHVKLFLYHQNLSFNAWNKLPTPSETKANIKDLNDEMMVFLVERAFQFLNLTPIPALNILTNGINKARGEKDFLKKQKEILSNIDRFNSMKNEIVARLREVQHELSFALQALLTGKLHDHKKLSSIDALIYTSLVAKYLGVLHNKNSEHATDRTAGAGAADKAQNAFTIVRGHSFLPGKATDDERALFKVFYSMYLVWEEPELNSGLSTGFVGEKFFKNFIQKNPETTRYLMHWLKSHPEMYLGLSKYRY